MRFRPTSLLQRRPTASTVAWSGSTMHAAKPECPWVGPPKTKTQHRRDDAQRRPARQKHAALELQIALANSSAMSIATSRSAASAGSILAGATQDLRAADLSGIRFKPSATSSTDDVSALRHTLPQGLNSAYRVSQGRDRHPAAPAGSAGPATSWRRQKDAQLSCDCQDGERSVMRTTRGGARAHPRPRPGAHRMIEDRQCRVDIGVKFHQTAKKFKRIILAAQSRLPACLGWISTQVTRHVNSS
jgi:hypothetical protein